MSPDVLLAAAEDIKRRQVLGAMGEVAAILAQIAYLQNDLADHLKATFKPKPGPGFAAAAQASMIDGCPCWACAKPMEPGIMQFPIFRVCPKCGNKRCPKCENHIYKCTGSNVPYQVPEFEPTHPGDSQ